MRTAKCSANSRMSARRSRSGGSVMTSNASRSSRSARNSPRAAMAGRSRLLAAIRRTSTCTGWPPPTRSNLPYSITRSSFSCTEAGVLASSSRNNEPSSARSKRPRRLRSAPVKAPASWPNNSDSSRLSGRLAQSSLINACDQRGDRKCKRSAISSLPVPRSPAISTGRFRAASREVCSSTPRKPGEEPMISCCGRDMAVATVENVSGADDGS